MHNSTNFFEKIIKKLEKTPDKYPRKAGKPSKEPII
jgi:hypothetical protein